MTVEDVDTQERSIDIVEWGKGEWYHVDKFYKVVAWMPMQKPSPFVEGI